MNKNVSIKMVDKERKYKHLTNSEAKRLKELGLAEEGVKKVDNFIDSVHFFRGTYNNHISIVRARRLLGERMFVSSILHCMYYGKSMRVVDHEYVMMSSTNTNQSTIFNAFAYA